MTSAGSTRRRQRWSRSHRRRKTSQLTLPCSRARQSPGAQLSRDSNCPLMFDQPQKLRCIVLVFEENDIQRTQEFVLRWSQENSKFWNPSEALPRSRHNDPLAVACDWPPSNWACVPYLATGTNRSPEKSLRSKLNHRSPAASVQRLFSQQIVSAARQSLRSEELSTCNLLIRATAAKHAANPSPRNARVASKSYN
jgi:hypothetical protein